MEFHITMRMPSPDIVAIDDAVRAADPAALVDLDGTILRVATSLRSSELTSAIAAAGYPLDTDQVTQLPSICCGGCSG